MIQIECSNCQTLLAIDDAFAGGVCRCQHCGTIQTVPKAGAESTETAEGGSPKALFKRKARIESALSPYNDGLDRAADEMDSSGALSANALANVPASKRAAAPVEEPAAGGSKSGSRVAAATATQKPAPAANIARTGGYMPRPSMSAVAVAAAPEAAKPKTAIIAGAAAGVILLSTVLWFALSGGDEPEKQQPDSAAPTATETSPAKAAQVPVPAPEVPVQRTIPPERRAVTDQAGSISGIPLSGDSVIYIVDRAGVTKPMFSSMNELCLKSASTLGTSRQFQLIVWNNYQELAFPSGNLVPATTENLSAARKATAETYPGSTDLAAALRRALAQNPAEIVLVSAVDLDEIGVADVRNTLRGHTVRFHGIAVGTDLTGTQLRKLVTEFDGVFKQVAMETLH